MNPSSSGNSGNKSFSPLTPEERDLHLYWKEFRAIPDTQMSNLFLYLLTRVNPTEGNTQLIHLATQNLSLNDFQERKEILRHKYKYESSCWKDSNFWGGKSALVYIYSIIAQAESI